MASSCSAARCVLARVLPAAALLLLAPALKAQSFSVGAGASIVSDQGTLVDVKAFNHWSSNVFGEVSIGETYTRHRIAFQLRWSRFALPGGVPNSPTLDVNAGLFAVSYAWREEWWQAGFIGGAGVYWLAPKELEPGQVVGDPNETVVGFWGGVFSVFNINRRWDVRLELAGHSPRTELSHTPLFLTLLVGYNF